MLLIKVDYENGGVDKKNKVVNTDQCVDHVGI
jgi:hypothetical protein